MVQIILESEHQYNFLSKTFILLPIPYYESRKVIIANSITPIFVKMFYDYMKNNFIWILYQERIMHLIE